MSSGAKKQFSSTLPHNGAWKGFSYLQIEGSLSSFHAADLIHIQFHSNFLTGNLLSDWLYIDCIPLFWTGLEPDIALLISCFQIKILTTQTNEVTIVEHSESPTMHVNGIVSQKLSQFELPALSDADAEDYLEASDVSSIG